MKPLKPYVVTLSVTAVVMAEDEGDAGEVADDCMRRIFSDAPYAEINFPAVFEVKTEADLASTGWDGFCIPYGGDGNTMLRDILGESV